MILEDLMALIRSYQDESLARMFEQSDTPSTRMEYEDALRKAHEKGWNDALRQMREPRIGQQVPDRILGADLTASNTEDKP